MHSDSESLAFAEEETDMGTPTPVRRPATSINRPPLHSGTHSSPAVFVAPTRKGTMTGAAATADHATGLKRSHSLASSSLINFQVDGPVTPPHPPTASPEQPPTIRGLPPQLATAATGSAFDDDSIAFQFEDESGSGPGSLSGGPSAPKGTAAAAAACGSRSISPGGRRPSPSAGRAQVRGGGGPPSVTNDSIAFHFEDEGTQASGAQSKSASPVFRLPEVPHREVEGANRSIAFQENEEASVVLEADACRPRTAAVSLAASAKRVSGGSIPHADTSVSSIQFGYDTDADGRATPTAGHTYPQQQALQSSASHAFARTPSAAGSSVSAAEADAPRQRKTVVSNRIAQTSARSSPLRTRPVQKVTPETHPPLYQQKRGPSPASTAAAGTSAAEHENSASSIDGHGAVAAATPAGAAAAVKRQVMAASHAPAGVIMPKRRKKKTDSAVTVRRRHQRTSSFRGERHRHERRQSSNSNYSHSNSDRRERSSSATGSTATASVDKRSESPSCAIGAGKSLKGRWVKPIGAGHEECERIPTTARTHRPMDGASSPMQSPPAPPPTTLAKSAGYRSNEYDPADTAGKRVDRQIIETHLDRIAAENPYFRQGQAAELQAAHADAADTVEPPPQWLSIAPQPLQPSHARAATTIFVDPATALNNSASATPSRAIVSLVPPVPESASQAATWRAFNEAQRAELARLQRRIAAARRQDRTLLDGTGGPHGPTTAAATTAKVAATASVSFSALPPSPRAAHAAGALRTPGYATRPHTTAAAASLGLRRASPSPRRGQPSSKPPLQQHISPAWTQSQQQQQQQQQQQSQRQQQQQHHYHTESMPARSEAAQTVAALLGVSWPPTEPRELYFVTGSRLTAQQVRSFYETVAAQQREEAEVGHDRSGEREVALLALSPTRTLRSVTPPRRTGTAVHHCHYDSSGASRCRSGTQSPSASRLRRPNRSRVLREVFDLLGWRHRGLLYAHDIPAIRYLLEEELAKLEARGMPSDTVEFPLPRGQASANHGDGSGAHKTGADGRRGGTLVEAAVREHGVHQSAYVGLARGLAAAKAELSAHASPLRQQQAEKGTGRVAALQERQGRDGQMSAATRRAVLMSFAVNVVLPLVASSRIDAVDFATLSLIVFGAVDRSDTDLAHSPVGQAWRQIVGQYFEILSV